MAYIANRPVRFDRDYAIGEVIPESVIEPTMTKRLVAMGKIICADIPTWNGAGENPASTEDGAEKPTEGGEATDGTNTQDEAENATDGESDGTEGVLIEELPAGVEATNDVPPGALEPNEDGTYNVYDQDGNVTGTISAEEYESAGTEQPQTTEEEYPVAGENPVSTEDGADGEEFKCEECGKVFKSANGLAAHMRVHKE